ncbi:hypothetical protein A2U01_0054660, partial [Trifolium medium]|nr:hypothetical protein [Trifolium medium]
KKWVYISQGETTDKENDKEKAKEAKEDAMTAVEDTTDKDNDKEKAKESKDDKAAGFEFGGPTKQAKEGKGRIRVI